MEDIREIPNYRAQGAVPGDFRNTMMRREGGYWALNIECRIDSRFSAHFSHRGLLIEGGNQ
jgi:hypothetical protein